LLDLSAWGLAGQTLPQILAKLTGLADKSALLILAVVSFGILAFVLKDKRFRGNLMQLVGSVVLGLLVVAAWYLTGHVGFGENSETM